MGQTLGKLPDYKAGLAQSQMKETLDMKID
jgi:hypothetical protein